MRVLACLRRTPCWSASRERTGSSRDQRIWTSHAKLDERDAQSRARRVPPRMRGMAVAPDVSRAGGRPAGHPRAGGGGILGPGRPRRRPARGRGRAGAQLEPPGVQPRRRTHPHPPRGPAGPRGRDRPAPPCRWRGGQAAPGDASGSAMAGSARRGGGPGIHPAPAAPGWSPPERVAADPLYVDAICNATSVAALEGREDEAVALLRQAAAIDPARVQVLGRNDGDLKSIRKRPEVRELLGLRRLPPEGLPPPP